MPSTYTLNLGIEKIATGEQDGTWGDTVNTNMDLFDTASNGQVSLTLPAAGSSGSPNDLTITDGVASDGRNSYIFVTDGGDLGATAFIQLTPNYSEKVCFIMNSLSGGQDLTVFQGTYDAGRDLVIENGRTMVVRFTGQGASASYAYDVLANLALTSLKTLGAVEAVGTVTGSNLSGTNTGDQSTIVGITGTKTEYNTSCSDGDFKYVGDAPTAHTHLLAAGATDVTATAGELNVFDLSATGLTAGWGYFASGASSASWRKLLGSEITNDLGWGSGSGTVTAVTGGTGLSSTGGTTPDISHDSHTGDVTGSTALTIGNDKVTYAKMQNMTTARILGRVTAGTEIIEELTAAQVNTLLGISAAVWDKSITIEAPESGDDITWFFTNRAITATEARFVSVGTTPSTAWTFKHGTDRSAAGTTIVSQTITSTTTGHDVTSFSDATIPANSFVWVEVGTTTGTVTTASGTMIGTVD